MAEGQWAPWSCEGHGDWEHLACEASGHGPKHRVLMWQRGGRRFARGLQRGLLETRLRLWVSWSANHSVPASCEGMATASGGHPAPIHPARPPSVPVRWSGARSALSWSWQCMNLHCSHPQGKSLLQAQSWALHLAPFLTTSPGGHGGPHLVEAELGPTHACLTEHGARSGAGWPGCRSHPCPASQWVTSVSSSLNRGWFQCLPCKAGERAQTVSQRMPTAQKCAVSCLSSSRTDSAAQPLSLALSSLPCRIPPDLC